LELHLLDFGRNNTVFMYFMVDMRYLTLLLGGLLWAGCAKTPGENDLASSVSFTANGQSYDQEYAETGSYSPSKGLITFQATVWMSNNTSLGFVFPDSIQLNKPMSFSNNFSMTYSYDPSALFQGFAGTGHGTLTLTGWDKVARTMSGTFSAVLEGTGAKAGDSTVISGGKFFLETYQLLP
jgi:hypothetical protein